MKKNPLKENQREFVIYQSQKGDIKVEAYFKDETIWLSQKKMAELFGVDRTVITKHLKNIFESNELNEKVVCAKIALSTRHGALKEKTQTNLVKYYNLDAILSVGYRVNSHQATQFRIWATKILKEYLIKGFILDDDRLKQNSTFFGKDYFNELLERVRSIRASERRIYLKITDLFAECAIDYNKNSKITQEFYATIQNKFHYAITNKTAAEIIYNNANAKQKNMGLSTWKNAPKGRILKNDTIIAKNYLTEKEIKKLERTISSYFDYIENQIEIRKEKLLPFTMKELSNSVNKFLDFNDFKILNCKGSISYEKAIEKAYNEYNIFNKTQKINSDFEKEIKRLEK